MELVIQIACGIVLGFLLLYLLPYILGAAVLAAVVTIIVALGIAAWYIAENYHVELPETLGYLFALVFGASWVVALSFLGRDVYKGIKVFVQGIIRGYSGTEEVKALQKQKNV